MSADLTFDEDQHVHILPVDQQKEAMQIVDAAKQYQDTLEQFNSISEKVISEIESLANQTEQRRKRALALRAMNATSQAHGDFVQGLGRAKLSARQLDMECMKLEVTGYEIFAEKVKQTKTAVTEIFGSQ